MALSEDLPISIQCVDDAEVCSGVIIYDDKEIQLLINQKEERVMANSDGHNSSVRVFQAGRCFRNLDEDKGEEDE